MGLFSWLFPKPADRIAKARRYLTDERYAEARLELIDVDDAQAVDILQQAERALVKLNIEKAIQRARAGDGGQVIAHLELAESFHDGSLDPLFEDARSQIAALSKAENIDNVFSNLRSAANRRIRLGTDPGDFTLSAYNGEGAVRLFFGGERPFNLPGLEYEPRHIWFKPVWLADGLDNGHDLIETYKSVCSPDHHAHVDAVSEVLAQALMHQGTERPELSVLALLELSISNPVVAYELGRSACALGCHDAAQLCFIAVRDALSDDLVIGDISSSFWSLTAALWAGDLQNVGAVLERVDQKADARLLATVAIESGHVEAAQGALDRLPADDEERPQLEGALRLQIALDDGFARYPIIKDPAERGTAAWNLALEAVTADLQVELDAVMGELRTLNESEIEDDLASEEEFFDENSGDEQLQAASENKPSDT
jgi:hypothetical protein